MRPKFESPKIDQVVGGLGFVFSRNSETNPASIAGLNTGLADVDSDALTHG
jgi:hypothetical protein